MWRPVMAQMGTLTEIKKEWSIDELAACHELLDYKQRMEAQAYEDARKRR